MAKDCKVKRRRYEQVGEKARKLRQWLGIDMRYTFDITKQIERLVGQTFGTLGVLYLDLFEQDNEDLAFVTFNPKLALHAHREIWDLARLGEPKSRFILAHELGHVLLHGFHRLAFSDDEARHMKSFPAEERAEPQADWFAEQFLAPDHLARNCKVDTDLCQQFDFPKAYAEHRLIRIASRRVSFAGQACPSCGNYTLVCKGIEFECDTCSATMCS
jgi:Zn-dependent peptidase ImmA (M78 family)